MRLLALAAAALALLLPACGRESPAPGKQAREVILYSSVDDYLLRDIVPIFEKESGIRIRLVGDTEATKTTGLVERLLAERQRPRADVWWSSEPFGTIRLAREGLLEPYAPADLPENWPFRGPAGDWHGFASRARVLVYNTARLTPEQLPTRLADLTDPRFKGKVGIARPQFGTTRGHLGYLLDACGEDAFRAWLQGLKANDIRIYDGNATIVRAVAQGEIDIGLTDTDDVWSGQRNTWPIALIYETPSTETPAWREGPAREAAPCAPPPMLIPNTVALLKDGPNPAAAKELIDFLLSPRIERLMAESDSRNIPIHPEIAAEFPALLVPDARPGNLHTIADTIPRALQIWDEIIGK